MPACAATWQVRMYETPSTVPRQCGQSPAKHRQPPDVGARPDRSRASSTLSPEVNTTGCPSNIIRGDEVCIHITFENALSFGFACFAAGLGFPGGFRTGLGFPGGFRTGLGLRGWLAGFACIIT